YLTRRLLVKASQREPSKCNRVPELTLEDPAARRSRMVLLNRLDCSCRQQRFSQCRRRVLENRAALVSAEVTGSGSARRDGIGVRKVAAHRIAGGRVARVGGVDDLDRHGTGCDRQSDLVTALG